MELISSYIEDDIFQSYIPIISETQKKLEHLFHILRAA